MFVSYTTWSHVRVHRGKMIWSCLPPHWHLFFMSPQCSNISCLTNNRAHCCLSGSFTAQAVNQHGNWTRGTKLGCEEGPIEKRRLLSRLGSVYALFWCNLTENADLCSYYCVISYHSHQVRLTMSSHAFLCSSALLKACWRTGKQSYIRREHLISVQDKNGKSFFSLSLWAGS